MLRLFIGAAAASVSLVVAYLVRRRYQLRLAWWAQYQQLLLALERQISLAHTPMPQVFADFCREGKGPLCAVLPSYPELPASVNGLSSEEWTLMRDALISLGRTDFAGQAKLLATARLTADSRHATASAEAKGKGALISKLTVLLGMALFLILL